MKKQILLVAFEKDVLKSFPVTLSLAGHEVLLAKSGLEAIKLAGETLPDLVVLDSALPDMDGQTVQGVLHRLPSTASIRTLLLPPRPHRLMPMRLQTAAERAGLVRALDTAELLRQVGDALSVCREMDAHREMTEMAI